MWANIIFAGILRNPYFHHICQIARQKNSPKKCKHWLAPGFIIGLNENETNFREIQENIVLVMSTLILLLTLIQFIYFKHHFKGGNKCTLKSSESPPNWMVHL